MANFAIADDEILDTVNYIISGPYSIGQDQEGIGESDPVYFTNNVSPYTSVTIPSPAPAADTWIKTDCFATIAIDQPTQKVSVGSQLRCFISYQTTSVPGGSPPGARILTEIAIRRFSGTADLVVDTNAGTTLSQTQVGLINFTTGTSTDEELGNQIIVSYIDQPGLEDTTGIYTYWLMFRISSTRGTHTITDFSADVRNLIATKIKT